MLHLRQYLDRIISLVPLEWESIAEIASVRHLKKGDLLLRSGAKADLEVFIETGIVRAYIIDEAGNEKSTAFFQSATFMSMNMLRSKNGFSNYNYQALCDTTVVLFNAEQLKTILSQSQKLTSLGKEIKEKEMERLVNRDECLLQVKASDKYLKFTKYHPKIEQYIAQRYIASYLGITPVSLSRLKKDLFPAKTVIN